MEKVEQKVGTFMIGVGCIMEHSPTGRILCLLREDTNYQKGKWELMYGRIDQHEELWVALRREVQEETGIEGFTIDRLLRVWHIYRGEKKPDTEVHGFTFHCTTLTDKVKLSAEHSEYRWVTPEEALELINIDGVKEDIRFFIKNKENTKLALSGVSNNIEHVF